MDKENGTILGIKKLIQAEENVANNCQSLVGAIWHVDGIMYPTSISKEAREILQKHRADLQSFKELNERINQRFRERMQEKMVLGC